MYFHCCDFPPPFPSTFTEISPPIIFSLWLPQLFFTQKLNGEQSWTFSNKTSKAKTFLWKTNKAKTNNSRSLGKLQKCRQIVCKRFRVQLGQALWRRRRQEKAETFCWIESHKSLHNFHSGSYTGWFFNWPPPKNVSRRIQGAPNKKNHLITDIQSCSFLFSKSCIHIKAPCRQLFTPII